MIDGEAMSVFGKIKQFLPGSSRSLHAMHRDVSAMHDEAHVQLAEIRSDIDRLYRRVEQADCGINNNLNYKYGCLSSDLDAHDAHMKMFAWENYRRGGESLAEAKKRFFSSLPKATGGMRLLQLGNAKLLGEFDALCREHGFDYWMMFGTLLGSVRNDGFIPWDDDVDLAMTRDDINSLIKLLECDGRYRVTTVYDEYAHCRQVRFAYADKSLPCFLDLFFLDWTSYLEEDSANRIWTLQDETAALMDADSALEFWRSDEHYLLADDARAKAIERHYQVAFEEARAEGLVCDKSQATGLIWGIDNIRSVQKWQSFPFSRVYPLQSMSFEGGRLLAPADVDFFLKSAYGDYFSLPRDINSHFEHVSHDSLEVGSSRKSLQRLIEGEPSAEGR